MPLPTGVVLIFDEGKTGNVIAAGGVVERYGVVPDPAALGKATGGGTPIGAILGSEEIMGLITERKVAPVGTCNGNPPTMAAAEARLTRVLDEAACARLDAAGERILRSCQEACDRFGLPAYAAGVAGKGCIMFSDQPVVDYRSHTEHFRPDLSCPARLHHMNHGLYMTPGADEQWTLSIAHTDEELDHCAAVFEDFARDVTATD